MFKSMKLGTKIMVGFGVLIAIAMALGGLATVKMQGVVGDSVMLAEGIRRLNPCWRASWSAG